MRCVTGFMTIIVIEGLSLTGKTTLCTKLIQQYSRLGKKCKYCHHGHLIGDPKGEYFYRKAIDAYNSWLVQDALRWSFLSLQQDWGTFVSESELYSEVDIFFLDRHYTSQYVAAEHFRCDVQDAFHRPSCYFEFLITADHGELLKRASARGDNHSRLTDYTLSNPKIHSDFEQLYKKHEALAGTPSEHIISNNDFSAFEKLILLINRLI